MTDTSTTPSVSTRLPVSPPREQGVDGGVHRAAGARGVDEPPVHPVGDRGHELRGRCGAVELRRREALQLVRRAVAAGSQRRRPLGRRNAARRAAGLHRRGVRDGRPALGDGEPVHAGAVDRELLDVGRFGAGGP